MKLDYMHQNAAEVRGWTLPVSVNGGKPEKLVLDTDASGISISRKYAEKIGLNRLARTTHEGIGDEGPLPAYMAIADSIRIGDGVRELSSDGFRAAAVHR